MTTEIALNVVDDRFITEFWEGFKEIIKALKEIMVKKIMISMLIIPSRRNA